MIYRTWNLDPMISLAGMTGGQRTFGGDEGLDGQGIARGGDTLQRRSPRCWDEVNHGELCTFFFE